MVPNIRHLRVFLEVARCHGISAAAEREHLSQPAVTQAVAKLEADLGVSLFERSSAGLHPTDIGAQFAGRVERVLEHLRAGAREARRIGAREARRAGIAREGRGFAAFERLVTHAQLRALIAVSEAKNFSMAAHAIGISQPSIHRSARNLERLSGVTMFETRSDGVALTQSAQVFAQRTKLAFAELRQGFDEIDAFLGRDSSHIVVGSLPLARTAVLPLAIDAMVRNSRGVQIRVIDGPYAELLRALRDGDIDLMIGALRDPPPVDDIEQETLFNDPLAIVAASNHPLATKKSVTIADTLTFPWVAPPRSTPAGVRLFNTLKIDQLAETPVRVVTGSLVLMRGLLMAGDYLTMISLHQVRHEYEQGLLVPLPIDMAHSERPIGLTTRRDWRPTHTQVQFISCLREASLSATQPRQPQANEQHQQNDL